MIELDYISLLTAVLPNYAIAMLIAIGGYRLFTSIDSLKKEVQKSNRRVSVIIKAMLAKGDLSTNDLKELDI